MDFRKYAARETSEMVSRLVTAASEKVTGDLQALRQAFDMVTGALDAALASQSNPEYQEQVAALVERLAAEADKYAEATGAVASKDADAAAEKARAELKAQSAELASLKAALKEAQAQAEALRAESKTQLDALRTESKTQIDALRAEVKAQKETIEAVRADSARVSGQRDAEAAQNEKVTAALSTVTTELQEAKAQARKLMAEAKAAETELAALKRTSDERERTNRDLQAKLKDTTGALATVEERAKAADAQVARVRTEADAAAKASAQAKRAVEDAESRAGRLVAEQAESMRKHAETFVTTSLDRLLDMHARAAKGASVEDVLAGVVEAMAAQFSRVALFAVQGNRLEGVRQVGFEVQDISQVLIPRTRDSLITEAVSSGNIETRTGAELEGSGLPFGGDPDFGLALPLVVEGECLAVVYADDANQTDREFAEPEVRAKFARLLQCQTAPLLARLAAEAKVVAELDQYASLLLKELEQTHAAEVSGGTPDGDRRKNLKENIEYARQMFAQRAAAEGPRAAALFDRKLFAAVDSQADTPFGRDILAVVGGRKRAAREAREARGGA